MALVTWTGKLSVGIESIDAQHRILFDAINELHSAVMRGQPRNEICVLLTTLLVYTRQHFAAEEEMLAAVNYPGLTEHRIEHRAFAKQFEDYVARYQRGDTTLRNDFAPFFSRWLNAHLQNVEESYAHFFYERGQQMRLDPTAFPGAERSNSALCSATPRSFRTREDGRAPHRLIPAPSQLAPVRVATSRTVKELTCRDAIADSAPHSCLLHAAYWSSMICVAKHT